MVCMSTSGRETLLFGALECNVIMNLTMLWFEVFGVCMSLNQLAI